MFGRKTVTPQMFGAQGNGKDDDTNSINKACEDLHRRGGGVLLFPKGVYLISSFDVYAKDFEYGAIQIYSNIEFRGEDGAIIKVADNMNRRDFAWQCVFIGRYKEETTNVYFNNLVFDLNGENNKYPIDNKDLGYHACCAAIRTGYPRNIRIENCKFMNCPGFNCVALGYADKAIVKNCIFEENADVVKGNSIYDHSCVIVAGNSIEISENSFTNKTRSAVATAIEVNSIGGVVRGNYVENFRVGCLVSPVGITSVKDISIVKNEFVNNRIAFQIWHQGENVDASHIYFTDNTITLTDVMIPSDYAIDARTYVKYPLTEVKISRNRITQTRFKDGSFYGGIIVGGKSSNVSVSNNEITGLSGSAITVIDEVKNITIESNLIKNCCLSNTPDANRYVLINPGKNNRSSGISVMKNKMVYNAGKNGVRGIWILNESENLRVIRNAFSGFQSFNEIDASLSKSIIQKK